MASAENVRLRSCGLKPLIEHFLLFSLFILSSTVYIVSGRCPNLCSGHGDCTQDSRCVCWRADKIHDTYWTGADCSLRECPRGSAWSDKASGKLPIKWPNAPTGGIVIELQETAFAKRGRIW